MIALWLLACTITITEGPAPFMSASARAEHSLANNVDLQEATARAALDTWIAAPKNQAAMGAVLRDLPLLREDIRERWHELNQDQQRWIVDGAARSGDPADTAFVLERWDVLPEDGRAMLVMGTPLPLGMTLIDAALHDPAPFVRAAGVQRVPLPAATDAVLKALNDPDPGVRRVAAERCPLPKCEGALAERLADPDEGVRSTVRERLGLPEPEPAPPSTPESAE